MAGSDLVNTKKFLVYFRHLQEFIMTRSDFDILTDTSFLDLFSKNIFETDLAFFFCLDEKTMDEVASDIYKAFCRIHDNLQNIRYFEIRQACLFKMMLKIIKYSCTIIDERGKDDTIFYKLSPIDALRIDTDLNPEFWYFINCDQFEMRIIYSFIYEGISPICPVTCIQPDNMVQFIDKFSKKPLFIVDDESFDDSIDNFVKKYIYKEYFKDAFKVSGRNSTECLYSGTKSERYVNTYTQRLEKLYEQFAALKQVNPIKYNQYEIIFAFEYSASKAYSVVIDYRLYIFEKVKNLGYIMQTYARGHITNKISTDIFMSRMIGKETVGTILEFIYNYTRSNNSELDLEEIAKNSIGAHESVYKKEFRLSNEVLRRFSSHDFRAQVPDFIFYP